MIIVTFFFNFGKNIAQWIIYNGSRTHCFFAEMLTSQNSTFVYESVRRQSNSPKPYKNMARQLLIRSWCHISFFVMNNIGYLHCSNWIFFLCCSKQRIWFFNDISKVLITLQIEIFWKLILWMKIVPLYETNNLNILPYFFQDVYNILWRHRN